MPPAGPLAAGVLAGHQPAEPHERGRPSEPSPVADLGGQRERAKLGHPAVGGQPGDLGGERWPIVPAGKVGLDRDQLRVAALQRRTIVRVLPYVGSARSVWVTHADAGLEPAVPC
jgi:hypothetical protein